MEHLVARLAAVERQLRIQRLVFGVALAVLAGAGAIPSLMARQVPGEVRTRSLVVEDGNGRPRIRAGAPLPGSGSPRTGLRITDTRGFERLGLNLFGDGRMVVGIDGPPQDSGPVGNLERINLVVEAEGTSYIVFKDRRSSVVARLYVDGSDRPYLEFSDYARNPPVRRRIGLAGEDSPR